MNSLDDIMQSIMELTATMRENIIALKDTLDMEEACIYLGLSKDYLYKLTSHGEIDHWKQGKSIYFDKRDLDAWRRHNRVSSKSTLQTLVNSRDCAKSSRAYKYNP